MQSWTVPVPQDLEYQKAHLQDSKVPQLIATGVLCLVIAYLGVGLRLFSRRLSRTPLRADDYTILGSLILTTAYSALLIALTSQGLGRHAILAKSPRLAVILGVTVELTYSIALPIIKVSTLLFLHRIFPSKAFSRKLHFTGFIILAYTIAQVVCLSIQCVPLSIIWSFSTTIEGKCFQIKAVLLVCAAMNIVTDLAIFALPIPKLWALQIGSKQRSQLIGIFLLGGFVCIISIIRIPKLLEYSLTDITWRDVDFAIWSGFELAIATLCACVPTMRPLLDCIFGRRLGTNTTSHTGTKSSPAEQHRPSWTPGGPPRSSFLQICEDEPWTRQARGKTTIRSSLEGGIQELQRPSSELEPPGLWGGGIKVRTEWELDFCEARGR